jgi:hypothetical protein
MPDAVRTVERARFVKVPMARVMALFVVVTVVLLAVLLTRQGGAETADGLARRDASDVRAHGGGSSAPVSERPAGTLVFTTGSNRLIAIDVASGRRTVRKVPSVAACGPQMYVTGGHVIFAAVQKGRTVVFSAPIALDEPPRRLGTAHAFVPSATEGRVWLAGMDCSRSAMIGAREVTVDGRVTHESRRRVPASWLAAAVPGGLVLQRSRTLVVWDPATGRTGRPLALEAVTAAHGRLLAGCAAGSHCSGLVILDASTARHVEAHSLHRYQLDLGARFSPDGSLLAAPALCDRRWSVALVDTRNGTTTIVPGFRARQYPQLSWAASSGWLFFQIGPRRMMAYRPGMSRAVALPFRPPRRAIAFIAG